MKPVEIVVVGIVAFVLLYFWHVQRTTPYYEALTELDAALTEASQVREKSLRYVTQEVVVEFDKAINEANETRKQAQKDRNFASAPDQTKELVEATNNVRKQTNRLQTILNFPKSPPGRKGGPTGTPYNENEALGVPH